MAGFKALEGQGHWPTLFAHGNIKVVFPTPLLPIIPISFSFISKLVCIYRLN